MVGGKGAKSAVLVSCGNDAIEINGLKDLTQEPYPCLTSIVTAEELAEIRYKFNLFFDTVMSQPEQTEESLFEERVKREVEKRLRDLDRLNPKHSLFMKIFGELNDR